jgi:hypothetical protein
MKREILTTLLFLLLAFSELSAQNKVLSVSIIEYKEKIHSADDFNFRLSVKNVSQQSLKYKCKVMFNGYLSETQDSKPIYKVSLNARESKLKPIQPVNCFPLFLNELKFVKSKDSELYFEAVLWKIYSVSDSRQKELNLKDIPKAEYYFWIEDSKPGNIKKSLFKAGKTEKVKIKITD